MGLITGLVSTVVHVAAGRNPYGHSHSHNHNHNQAVRPVVTTAGYADPADACGCGAGPGGQPCGICAVATPFGKGRQQKRERKAMRHAQKAQRFFNGRYPGYVPGGREYRGQEQPQQGFHFGGQSLREGQGTRQEGGIEEARESRRRASTGDEVAPPAYEEAESSRIGARRSVGFLRDGDEKREEAWLESLVHEFQCSERARRSS